MFDDQKTPKVKLEVEIELSNTNKFLGFVFVSPQGRLSDLFNDDREFLPVELSDGRTLVVRKSAIVQAAPMEHSKPVESKTDPYEY